MSTTVFDFAIIGAGAAGLNLALAMQEDPFFKNKKILILEKEAKNIDDKTWCYWEAGKGKWDELLTHRWERGIVHTGKEEIELKLKDYSYKMIRSLDFYTYAFKKLKNAANFQWFQKEVSGITREGSTVLIDTKEEAFFAKQVFDSRITADQNAISNTNTVLQHFKGWFIETEKPVFDPSAFMMMDFRLTWKDSTSFTYVLPLSKNYALVEFTFFSPHLVDDSVYEKMLKQYVEKILKPGDYKILKTEAGIIPMSDYAYHKNNNRQITKIGTAGSWVKPSSGYSFRNSIYYSKQIVNNLKEGMTPSANLFSKKHRHYDSIFLNVLKNENHLGPSVFNSMYRKNTARQIFRFLDEETTFKEDLKIISGFDKAVFTKALFNKLLK